MLGKVVGGSRSATGNPSWSKVVFHEGGSATAPLMAWPRFRSVGKRERERGATKQRRLTSRIIIWCKRNNDSDATVTCWSLRLPFDRSSVRPSLCSFFRPSVCPSVRLSNRPSFDSFPYHCYVTYSACPVHKGVTLV